MTPPRVAFVSSHAKLGGAELYLRLLLERLGQKSVAQIVALEDGPFVERLRAEGRDVDVLPTSRRALGIAVSGLRLRRTLARSGVDVVHANGIKAAVACAVASFAGGPPVVWVKHDFSWDGALARAVGARCREVVCVSSAVGETFAGTGVRWRVVHNGIPPARIDREAGRQALTRALGASEPMIVVGIVGRMDPIKGHRELLAALPAVRARAGDVRAVFVGEEQAPYEGYADELLAEAAKAGLGDAVTYLGYRPDAPNLIAGFDAIAIPTVVDPRGGGREGFSYVALEAIAAGTPVVGYAHGGVPEIVEDCGLLVTPGDRAALAGALGDLLDDDALRDRLAACGRARFEREFSLARTVAAMQDVYAAAAKAGA